MKLIEVHNNGYDLAINIDFISGVYADHGGGCRVYMHCEAEPFYVDESYTEVLRLIKEASDD